MTNSTGTQETRKSTGRPSAANEEKVASMHGVQVLYGRKSKDWRRKRREYAAELDVTERAIDLMIDRYAEELQRKSPDDLQSHGALTNPEAGHQSIAADCADDTASTSPTESAA